MSEKDPKRIFWDRINKAKIGMLSAAGTKPRPMAHHARKDDNALWFITDNHSDIGGGAAAGRDARYQVASGDADLYAVVDGTLSVEVDRAKLDEIWAPLDAAWFEEGKDDPDVCLVRFTPKSAEVWAHESTAKAFYKMSKAALSEGVADPGIHGKIFF